MTFEADAFSFLLPSVYYLYVKNILKNVTDPQIMFFSSCLLLVYIILYIQLVHPKTLEFNAYSTPCQ